MTGVVEIMEAVRKAAALLSEGHALVEQITRAVRSTKQAFSATELEELESLLSEARSRRVEADRELQEALSGLQSR